MFVRDVWLSSDIFQRAYRTKDDERADWLMTLHPNYHQKDAVEKWLCIDMLNLHGPLNRDAGILVNSPPSLTPCPNWLTADFKSRIRLLFVWWAVDESVRKRVDDALNILPTFVPAKIETTERSAPNSKKREGRKTIAPS